MGIQKKKSLHKCDFDFEDSGPDEVTGVWCVWVVQQKVDEDMNRPYRSSEHWWIFPSKIDEYFLWNVMNMSFEKWLQINRNLVSYINRMKNTEMRHLLDDMKNELQMKDVPKTVIALDWFELHSGEKTARDIYNLSKHVKSLFLSSHRPSWHITRLQLQFKCPTKSIPIFNLNVQQNPSQSSNLNVPYKLNVRQNPPKSPTLISPS